MARVSDPQPGNTYRIICADRLDPHKTFVFRFVNMTRDGRFDIEVDGERMIVGSLCKLCGEYSCEVWDV